MKTKILKISLIIVVLILLGICLGMLLRNKSKENNQVSNTDEQGSKYDYLVLVNKYSKLPDDREENVELVTAKDAWGDEIKLEKETYENYLQLKDALSKEGVTIELDSVYRSVAEQQDLWDRWTVEKGIDYVRKYVAVPGYSEHHTGLAVDICIRKDGELVYENEDMIAEREIFAKIHEKLADYGFILRYLEGRDDITGYAYEPWHLRYVGSSEIAKEIMDKNITFEEYLESVKDIKNTPAAAKYMIEKTLQKYFTSVYGDKISNSRFNVKAIYSVEDGKNNVEINSLNLGDNDIAFRVEYQLQPSEGVNPNELMVVDGEYDENLGWVKNINRVGVLKYNPTDKSYSITDFGTGF